MAMVLLVKSRQFRKLVIILLLAIVGFFLIVQRSSSFREPKNYEEAVSYFEEISIKEVKSKLENNDSFILYIGRETCPYCQRFVPKLAQAVYETKIKVYYVDSDSDEREEITKFAQLKGIKTVPSLGFYRSYKLDSLLKKGSKSSVEEIKSFLKDTKK